VAPSILLVTIDTLRADRVGAYGDAQARTPHLDALARSGLAFDRAYSPAPLTLPSHTTILTGLLPPAHGVRGNGAFALGPGPPTLAEALRARGLRTAAFVGGFPLSRRFGLDRGFEHYDDRMEKAPGLHFEFAERRASEVVSAARTWLAAATGPVFVWVHLFDPHAPYDPPPAFAGPDPYRGEIAAADAALGDLMAAWDARKGPSYVAVTSDHGEAFGEHGEESHSLFVYDATLHVPLVLRGHGLPAGRRQATPVGLADLAATLLARVGGAGPSLPGRDLTATPLPAVPLYAETLAPRLDFGWSDLRAWRDSRFKLVRAPRPELYDVDADPGETRDLARSDPRRTAAMDAALGEALAAMGERESVRRPDSEAAERLRALGYAQGPGGTGSGADPKDRVEVALAIARAAGPFPDAGGGGAYGRSSCAIRRTRS
jgi:arylsulfatase A-like enzyme